MNRCKGRHFSPSSQPWCCLLSYFTHIHPVCTAHAPRRSTTGRPNPCIELAKSTLDNLLTLGRLRASSVCACLIAILEKSLTLGRPGASSVCALLIAIFACLRTRLLAILLISSSSSCRLRCTRHVAGLPRNPYREHTCPCSVRPRYKP